MIAVSRRLSSIPELVADECTPAIIRLLGVSGAQGLEAFLPEEGIVFPSLPEDDVGKASTPHLPVTSDWRATDFSVSSVLQRTGWYGLSQRTFAMRLLLRYQYSISASRHSQALSDCAAHVRHSQAECRASSGEFKTRRAPVHW